MALSTLTLLISQNCSHFQSNDKRCEVEGVSRWRTAGVLFISIGLSSKSSLCPVNNGTQLLIGVTVCWNIHLRIHNCVGVCVGAGHKTRRCVHHIQSVEHQAPPRGCGTSLTQHPYGPPTGVPGSLPHPLALRLPVSTASSRDARIIRRIHLLGSFISLAFFSTLQARKRPLPKKGGRLSAV